VADNDTPSEKKPGWVAIPQELKELKQWVLWKLVKRKGQDKPTKVPFQVNGKNADSTKPETWNTFDLVVKTYTENPGKYNGIGFVFSENDPYVGIDIDNCIIEGVIGDSALNIIQTLNGYTETSPSGSGIHIIVKGTKPGTKNRKGPYEMYDRGRYFTMTGDAI
jgi:putative DNA primase/helicase